MAWKEVLRGTGVSRPGALNGLASMRHPQTAPGELMQFLQAINWLRTSSKAGRGCRASSSAAVGAHGGN